MSNTSDTNQFDVCTADVVQAANEAGEAWRYFEVTLADAITKAGGGLSAEIDLPDFRQ